MQQIVIVWPLGELVNTACSLGIGLFVGVLVSRVLK